MKTITINGCTWTLEENGTCSNPINLTYNVFTKESNFDAACIPEVIEKLEGCYVKL